MKPTCIGVFAASLALGEVALGQEPNAFSLEARRVIASVVSPQRSERPVERTALERLYSPARLEPLWSRDGTPTRQALESISMLTASDAQGLAPTDYDADSLAAWASSLAATTSTVARFDVELSRAIIRLLADVHIGRLDPRSVRFALPGDDTRLDLAAQASAVAGSGDVWATLAGAEPAYAGYARLKDALRRYRHLAADTELRLPAHAPQSLRAGDAYADAPTLRRLLRALGDLDSAPSAPAPNDSNGVYDGALAEAVARFQRRHGLDPDGVVGRETMAELRTPLARRVRQIELTLERWRWLPHEVPARFAVVNIPAFRLYAFENDPAARHPVLAMNAIVGEARGGHATPVFVGTMREIVFQPYWDVPPRIAHKELIPLFRRRPAYYAAEGFEIVRVGDAGERARVYPPTASNFARVIAGELRLRQRPGPTNALGPVKFVFPNPYHVFLHGTPAQELFARSRRDFSHGCIRIEEPRALAELALRGTGTWDTVAIDAAMRGSRTRHVPIEHPMTVFVMYATAAVEADGVARFYPDIYVHDSVLERALGLTPVNGHRGIAEP